MTVDLLVCYLVLSSADLYKRKRQRRMTEQKITDDHRLRLSLLLCFSRPYLCLGRPTKGNKENGKEREDEERDQPTTASLSLSSRRRSLLSSSFVLLIGRRREERSSGGQSKERRQEVSRLNKRNQKRLKA